MDVAKDVFPDESPYVYQALQFLLNLAERAGVLDENFTRAYAGELDLGNIVIS